MNRSASILKKGKRVCASNRTTHREEMRVEQNKEYEIKINRNETNEEDEVCK